MIEIGLIGAWPAFEYRGLAPKRLFFFAERAVNVGPEEGKSHIPIAFGNECTNERFGSGHVLPARFQPFCGLMALGDIERSFAVHLEPPCKTR
jgi:hypothetical protein